MKIFEAELIASAPNVAKLPPSGLPEVAFLGRSNVGKSSLLNALARRKKLARTSSTPGKTRDIVLFRVRTEWGTIGLVDLPGYGWAKVSRKERESWQRVVEDYLAKREELRLGILLQDIRRSWSEDESLLLEWLAEQSVPGRVVLTKTDKLKLMKRKERIRKLSAEIGDAFGKPIATSSQSGAGLELVWKTCFEFSRKETDESSGAAESAAESAADESGEIDDPQS